MSTQEHPWRDEERLRRMYIDKKMSAYEIGDELGCAQRTVSGWLNRHDIPTRSIAEAKEYKTKHPFHPSFRTAKRGDVVCESSIKTDEGFTKKTLYLHRLIMVAMHGFDAVCGMHVHHKNEIKWDNRPDNLELLTHGEHSDVHNRKLTWLQKLAIIEMYRSTDATMGELGEMYEVHATTIGNTIRGEHL